MEMIKARQLKGGLILSKCVTDLVSFYKKCSFSPAEAQLNRLLIRNTLQQSLYERRVHFMMICHNFYRMAMMLDLHPPRKPKRESQF